MTFPKGQFGVIYADPPWSYEMYSEQGHAKSPHAHYGCMPHDALIAMRDDILFAAAPDCVLFMWAVFPMLPEALRLMEAWGFTYKTAMPWNKVTTGGKRAFGTGYILRAEAEILLIGTAGNPRAKDKNTRGGLHTDDVPEDLRELGLTLYAQRREHSRKPDEMIPLIENLFDGPYLEIFARTERPGWTVFGNETEKFA